MHIYKTSVIKSNKAFSQGVDRQFQDAVLKIATLFRHEAHPTCDKKEDHMLLIFFSGMGFFWFLKLK